MIKFDHALVAENSSGVQFLHVHKDCEGAFNFSITGEWEKSDIQLNFDTLNVLELNQLIEKLEYLRDMEVVL